MRKPLPVLVSKPVSSNTGLRLKKGKINLGELGRG